MSESPINLEIIWYITLVQLWWIAIWGIAYIVIDYVSNKYKITELFVYTILLIFVFAMILMQPNLLNHA
jgi:hypothetical protein